MNESEYEAIIMSSIIESKTLKNSTDLSIWRSKYMNKVKIIQQEYLKDMKPYRTDKNSIMDWFSPNFFDLETWFNTFNSVLGDLETNFAEFLNFVF